jgi:hypothetical protein
MRVKQRMQKTEAQLIILSYKFKGKGKLSL